MVDAIPYEGESELKTAFKVQVLACPPMRIEVVCINDKNKPDGIPANRWVKENQIYHITQIDRCVIQGGMYGCKLEEINNDDLFPYTYFDLRRFAHTADIAPLKAVLEQTTTH